MSKDDVSASLVQQQYESDLSQQGKDFVKAVGIVILAFLVMIVFVFVFNQFYEASFPESDNPCKVTFAQDTCTPTRYDDFCQSNNTNEDLYTCRTYCIHMATTPNYEYCPYEQTCIDLDDLNFPYCNSF